MIKMRSKFVFICCINSISEVLSNVPKLDQNLVKIFGQDPFHKFGQNLANFSIKIQLKTAKKLNKKDKKDQNPKDMIDKVPILTLVGETPYFSIDSNFPPVKKFSTGKLSFLSKFLLFLNFGSEVGA